MGALGATTLKLTLSAVVLLAIARPWRVLPGRAAVVPLIAYGLALAGMNICFNQALRTVPLGVAVAVDFLGPLGVAVAQTRRLSDALWVLLATGGIALLLPAVAGADAIDPVGLLWCVGAATSWALYIVMGARAGRLVPGAGASAICLAIAAAIVLPFGIASVGATALLSLQVLPLAVTVALLSGAVAYRLEMVALTRLPTRQFGVMMSLEPAFGALFGATVLGEWLSGPQWIALVLVTLASAGATLTARRPGPAAI